MDLKILARGQLSAGEVWCTQTRTPSVQLVVIPFASASKTSVVESGLNASFNGEVYLSSEVTRNHAGLQAWREGRCIGRVEGGSLLPESQD